MGSNSKISKALVNVVKSDQHSHHSSILNPHSRMPSISSKIYVNQKQLLQVQLLNSTRGIQNFKTLVFSLSGGMSGSNDTSLDADYLLEIRERFKELTKEKEMLRDSKSQGFELIRRLEYHVRTLSVSREEDKKRITDLERELSNSVQEIDFLQDQLSMRNLSLNCPGEQVCSCRSKLADMENLAEEVEMLREQINQSESEKSLLVQEIEDKEDVITYSASHIANLEESISSMELEYQCEIESMNLYSINLEQNLLKTKRLLEETSKENSRMNGLIESLEKENNDLKEKLRRSDMSTKAFVMDVEEQLHELLGKTDGISSNKLEKDMSTYGNALGPLFSKLASLKACDADLRNKMERQIDDYELLTRRLKEELREERLKSKEEAEDLAQEMAELRYQLTVMLEDERKRRANIEHISIQRISELEAQIAKERKKSNSPHALVVRNQ